jgi:hypothetical protein
VWSSSILLTARSNIRPFGLSLSKPTRALRQAQGERKKSRYAL